MSLHRFRWSKVYESSEEELVAFMRSRTISSVRITADPFDELKDQTAAADTTIWCAEGSLKLNIGTISKSLQPGDAVRLPADTPYGLQAGMSGYVCYISG